MAQHIAGRAEERHPEVALGAEGPQVGVVGEHPAHIGGVEADLAGADLLAGRALEGILDVTDQAITGPEGQGPDPAVIGADTLGHEGVAHLEPLGQVPDERREEIGRGDRRRPFRHRPQLGLRPGALLHLLPGPLVQPGVLDGDGRLGREQLQHPDPPLGEGVGGEPVLHVEHADHGPLAQHRSAEQGAGACAHDVGVVGRPLVHRGVGDHHRLAGPAHELHHAARQVLAPFQGHPGLGLHRDQVWRPRHSHVGPAVALQQEHAAIRPGRLQRHIHHPFQQPLQVHDPGDGLSRIHDAGHVQGVFQRASGLEHLPQGRGGQRRFQALQRRVTPLHLSDLGRGTPLAVAIPGLGQEDQRHLGLAPPQPELSVALVDQGPVPGRGLGPRRCQCRLVQLHRVADALLRPGPLG